MEKAYIKDSHSPEGNYLRWWKNISYWRVVIFLLYVYPCIYVHVYYIHAYIYIYNTIIHFENRSFCQSDPKSAKNEEENREYLNQPMSIINCN